VTYTIVITCVIPDDKKEAARLALEIICDRERWPYVTKAEVVGVCSYVRAHRF
jgi:hypothetical protein